MIGVLARFFARHWPALDFPHPRGREGGWR